MWLCPVTAHALADPADIFQPYVLDTVMYDDNLFRQNKQAGHVSLIPILDRNGRPTGQTNNLIKDDVMNQATVGGTVNYPLGRQKLNLNLQVAYNNFVNNTFLNNLSANNRAAWQWELGRQLSGDVGYAYNRAMGGFTNTTFFGLDIITGNNAFANLNYAWHPRWKMRTGFSWQDYQHSASQRKILDQDSATASLAVNHTSPSNNSTGLEYNFIDGKFPNRELIASTLIDNKYRQHNIRNVSNWKITEKILFNGNVGYSNRQYPDFSQRNFSGPTFNLTLSWTATDKSMLSISGWRQLAMWTDVTASYVITEGFSISPMWRPSPKLTLTAKFDRQMLDYAGDPGLVSRSALRQDTVLSGQVSVAYKPIPNAEITLGYQGGTRNTINTLVNWDYTFNSVFTSAMLKF